LLPAGLRLCGPTVRPLFFEDDEMERFAREVRRIYAVDHSKPPLGDGQSPPSAFVPPRDVAESLRQMRAACRGLEEDCGDTWRLHEPLDDVFCARHLIAADFEHTKCVELVRNYASWRRQLQGGVPPDLSWLKGCVATIPFEDVMGRPVFLVRVKYFDAETPVDTIRAWYRGLADAAVAHLLLKRGQQMSELNPLEQYVLVLDVIGASRGNWRMRAVQVMIAESNANYPDRVAQMFVLGANLAVRGLWNMVSPLVHPRTRNKVHMVSAEEAPATMRTLVGQSEWLPEEYGGSAPRLIAPPEARSLVDMAGRVAFGAWEQTGALQLLDQRTARSSRVGIAWHVPRSSLEATQMRSSFRMWLSKRGEATAVVRSQEDVVEFLSDLLRSSAVSDLGEGKAAESCCPAGSWMMRCLAFRRDAESQRALLAARSPEVLGRCFGKILSDYQGREPARAVLDFVTGSGRYVIRR